jgi:hypothetical protein
MNGIPNEAKHAPDTRPRNAKRGDRMWGRHWTYIINGKNVRPVEPFDIDEIKVSSKNYGTV